MRLQRARRWAHAGRCPFPLLPGSVTNHTPLRPTLTQGMLTLRDGEFAQETDALLPFEGVYVMRTGELRLMLETRLVGNVTGVRSRSSLSARTSPLREGQSCSAGTIQSLWPPGAGLGLQAPRLLG